MNLKLNVKNINEVKADPKSTHVMEYRFPGQEDEPVRITYKSIKSGEMMSFLSADEEGGSINARAVFQRKIVKIENFFISDESGQMKEMKSAADVLAIPLVPEVEAFIYAVFGRIYNESRLTEDEEKNSDGDISASEQDS